MTNHRHSPSRLYPAHLSLLVLFVALTPLGAADDASDLSKIAPDVLTKDQQTKLNNLKATDNP